MKTLLTSVTLLLSFWATAQKGTLSWSDLDHLVGMELSAFEKEIAGMGFTPAAPGATSSECVSLVYTGAAIASYAGRTKATTMRCNNGRRTLSFSTPDEAHFKKMKDDAAAQLTAAGNSEKQMQTDRVVEKGIAYFTISISGNWPK
ncbi:MAG: hypothetical protein ABI599_04135 [Flavobacteriales bacterium]